MVQPMVNSATSEIYGFLSRSVVPPELFTAKGASESEIAALAFMLWDTMIYFSDEVEYIWKGPNTWIKYMYIFIRHVPLTVQVTAAVISASPGILFSEHVCKSVVIFEASTMVATTLAVELILVIRVYVMYSRSKIVLWALSPMFLAEIGVMIMSVARTIPQFRFTPHCLSTTAASIFLGCWLSSLVFESILFILTLVQFIRVVHRDYVTGKHTFVYIFIRDGIWAFALIFVIFLITTLMYQLDAPVAAACFFWALAIVSFTGSHVLLNLRQLVLTSLVVTTRTSDVEYLSEHHEMAFRRTIGSAAPTHEPDFAVSSMSTDEHIENRHNV